MFLLNYIRHPKTTGALCKSSKNLAQVITDSVNLKCANNIIEIGAGSGAFTQMILQKKSPSAKFFAVEINPNFARELKVKFPTLDIALGSAKDLGVMMKERDMASADIIISGIPWSFLSVREQSIMLKSVYGALSNGGYFNAFAYHSPLPSAKIFSRKLHKTFGNVQRSKSVVLNIPPAFVYICQKMGGGDLPKKIDVPQDVL